MSCRSVLITGASKGLGKALAELYAQEAESLFLCARNYHELSQVQQDLNKVTDAKVITQCTDVTNAVQMAEFIKVANDISPPDLVIANAGVSVNQLGGIENHGSAYQTFQTNNLGVINTIYPSLEYMKQMKSGQIAIISSAVGLLDFMPLSPAYAASKSALISLAESLRSYYKPHRIKINVICPGFIATGMTSRNEFRMPFMVGANTAAKIIRQGLKVNKSPLIFPFKYKYTLKFLNTLPIFIRHSIIRSLIKYC